MGNEAAVQQSAKGLTFAVPAYLTARIKAGGLSNIAEKSTVNQLTFGGKAWTTHVNGDSKLLQRRSEDGELENVQILRVIVLDYAKVRGRNYYAQNYDSKNIKPPDCFSDDGRKPHSSVAEPKNSVCETCAMAAKGSKIFNGKEMIACQQHRLLAVIPAADLKFPPLRLKFSVTSDWDKQDEESSAAGWYGWSNYTDLLRANGLDFTGALVTKMRFANTEYPKIQFARGDFLDEDALTVVERLAKSDEVQKLLSGFTPSAAAKSEPKGKPLPQDDEPTPEEIAADNARAAEVAAFDAVSKAKAAADAEAAAVKAEADRKAAERVAKVAVKKAAAEKAAAEAAAKAKPAEDDGAWDERKPINAAVAALTTARATETTDMPARRAAPQVTVSPGAVVEVPAALTGILGAWGE